MADDPNLMPGTAQPSAELIGADRPDPVIEAYMKDVDRTLLRENLKLTVAQRFEKFERFLEYARELRDAGRRARKRA
jgi:hypothetical protein